MPQNQIATGNCCLPSCQVVKTVTSWSTRKCFVVCAWKDSCCRVTTKVWIIYRPEFFINETDMPIKMMVVLFCGCIGFCEIWQLQNTGQTTQFLQWEGHTIFLPVPLTLGQCQPVNSPTTNCGITCYFSWRTDRLAFLVTPTHKEFTMAQVEQTGKFAF